MTTIDSTNNKVQDEVILTTFDDNSTLPCVLGHMNGISFPMLIDSGSTICLIDTTLVDFLKGKIPYKILSRQVNITTINSTVAFSGCIEFSFKLKNNFFKQAFYITDISHKSFSAILGYNFITKYAITIASAFDAVLFKDDKIPFIKYNDNVQGNNNYLDISRNEISDAFFQNKSNSNKVNSVELEGNYICNSVNVHQSVNNIELFEQPVDNCNVNNSHDLINQNSSNVVNDKLNSNDVRSSPPTNHVNIEDINNFSESNNFSVINNFSEINNSEIDNISETVLSSYRTLIPENGISYIKVKVKNKPTSSEFIFNPILEKPGIVVHPSLHSLAHLKDNSFLIVIENRSAEQFFLKKNIKIGTVSNVTKNDIQENNWSEEACNVIHPSVEVVQQRAAEFNINDFCLDHLNSLQKKEMVEILEKYTQAFSKSLSTIGHTDLVTPQIDIRNSPPVKTLPYPIPQALQDEAKKQLNEMLAAGIIKRANSSWACPMLLVKKKMLDPSKPQQFRLALDLRLLNAVIMPSTYPLPKIQTLLSNLASFKFFTTLDLPSAYWQIHMPQHLRDKVTFTTPWGCFSYNRLVFGLRTAASTFQQLIDELIQQAEVEGVFSYQDDVVIGANSFAEMKTKLSQLLEVFIKNNITLSSTKCQFHKSKINFLGFEIANHQVMPMQSNIRKILAFPTPKTKKQVKSFIGLCSFYRSLIPAFARRIEPLIKLTSPKEKFKWSQLHEEAFQDLQQVFFKKPILHLPNWDETFYVNTDASVTAISAVLMQKKNGLLLPISFYSKLLSPSEKKYPPIKLELYAIFKGITSFKYQLYNRHFVVLSDAKPLNHYKNSSSPADIITRWLMEISEYSFSFEHIPGSENILADYISRIPVPSPSEDIITNPKLLETDEIIPVDNSELDLRNNLPHDLQRCNHFDTNHDSPCFLLNINTNNHISDELLYSEQRKDHGLRKIINKLENNTYKGQNNPYYLHPQTNILCYDKFFSSELNNLHRAVLPTSLLSKALALAHVTHAGFNKTLENVKKRFTWRTMAADISNYINSCQTCLLNKNLHKAQAPLLPTPLPTACNQKVSMDLVGPFKNHSHILTVVDHFSRHLELYNLQTISAPAVTKALLHYCATHGKPDIVQTDQGKQFDSSIFSSFNDKLHMKLAFVTVAHPQANGLSESLNRQLKSAINTMLSEGYDLFTAMKVHQNLYNSTIHPATKFTPNKVHFGREMTDFYENYKSQGNWTLDSNTRNIHNVFKTLDKIYHHAYINNEQFKRETLDRCNAKRKFMDLQINDKVYITFPNVFKKRKQGPYWVKKIISPSVVQLQICNNPNAFPILVHTDRILKVIPKKTHLQEHKTQDNDMSQNFLSPSPNTNSDSEQFQNSPVPAGESNESLTHNVPDNDSPVPFSSNNTCKSKIHDKRITLMEDCESSSSSSINNSNIYQSPVQPSSPISHTSTMDQLSPNSHNSDSLLLNNSASHHSTPLNQTPVLPNPVIVSPRRLRTRIFRRRNSDFLYYT